MPLALITGAGGFLGRAIAQQLLARSQAVRGLARGAYPELEQAGVEMRRGDVRDRQAVLDACRGVDVVYHVAAVAGIWGPWDHFYSINTLGTRHVLEACRECGVRRLVFCSSPSVTFDGRDQVNVDESVPYASRWLCHYPHTKALAEQMVLDQNGRDGLLTCALRPHLIWGPGDQHLIPRLIQRARQGKLMRVGDGTNLIDTIYIDNAAAAHIRAADALTKDSPVAGRAYFLSQGEPVNCWDWIDQLLDLAGLPPVRRAISLRAAWRIGHAFELAHRALRIRSEPRMTRFLAAQLGTSHYFNIARAREDFGYHPQVSTEEGMHRLGSMWRGEPHREASA